MNHYIRFATGVALIAISTACSVDLAGIGGAFANCGDNSDACQKIDFVGGNQVLLLGDTAGVDAYDYVGDTDFRFQQSTPAVSFIGSPVVIPHAALGHARSHVTVRADMVGISSITAFRKGQSATTSMEVIPPSVLRGITISRHRCTTVSAAFCFPTDADYDHAFKDTIDVGEGLRLEPKLVDASGRAVVATVAWTSSDPSVALPMLVAGILTTAIVVYPQAAGDAVITASVAGVSNSFVLHVK